MSTLQYIGKPVSQLGDVVYRDYVQGLKSGDLTTEQVDTMIQSDLAPYATVQYVDQRDSLLATKAYIDQQDQLRVPNFMVDQAGGVAGLSSALKINPARFQDPTTQKYFRGPYSPTSYPSSAWSATTEQTIYQCPVEYPGYPYKVIVFGMVDTRSDLDTEYPVFNVRVANQLTGPIVGKAQALQDSTNQAFFSDNFQRGNNSTANGLGPDWSQDYWESGGGTCGIYNNTANWYDSGSGARSMRALRVNAVDRYTGTDFQMVGTQIGHETGEGRWSANDYQYLRHYLRISDNKQSYSCFEITEDDVRLIYNTGSGEQQLGQTFAISGYSSGEAFYSAAGNLAGDKRVFSCYKNGSLIGSITDSSNLTPLGNSNRGWGFGMRAAPRGFGQTSPPSLYVAGVVDYVVNWTTAAIMPRSLDTQAPLTGSTILYVRAVRSGSAANISGNNRVNNLHVLTVPA